MSENRPTLPKPPSLIASRTQTISSVSFEEAPATPPTREEAANKAFATPAHRKVPETPLGPTPPKPSKEASDHLDVKTQPRVQAKNVTPSPDCPAPPALRRGNSIRSSSVARLPEGRVCLVVLAARQPATSLPSGSLVRRGTRKTRLAVDANDNQEAARRSWDAAEALCAVADAASPPES